MVCNHRLTFAFTAAVLAVLLAPPVLAESYKVSQFHYFNNGEYESCPEVVWTDDSGRQQVSRPDYCVKRSHTTTLNFDELDNPPPAGTEVWLQLRIVFGDVESCRTSEATFHYDPGGERAKFRTDGTPLDRNRCKLTCEDCKAK